MRMRGPIGRRACGSLAVICWLMAAAASATGSPLIDPYIGGVVFTGAAHGHPSAIYLNPAAMRLASGTHVFLAGTARLDDINIARAPIAADGSPSGPAGASQVSALNLTPGGYAAVFTDFNGDRVTAGIATYTPFAERFLSNRDELRYHTLGGHAYEWFVTPAVAIRVNRQLSVGLGVTLVALSSFRLKTARDTALEGGSAGLASDCGGAPCGAENPQASEVMNVRARQIFGNFAFHLGITYQPRPNWTIGIGYVSPPSEFGTLNVSNDGTVAGTAAPRDGGEPFTGLARVSYRLPQSLQLGVRGGVLERWELVVNGRWVSTGRQEDIDIRLFGADIAARGIPEAITRYRHLRDLWSLEVGIENRERSRLRLGGRLRVENGGVAVDDMSPLQVESLNASLAAGAEVRVSERFAIAIGYAFRLFGGGSPNPGNFDPAARIACVDSGFDFDQCGALRDGRAIPTAAADYSRLQHTLSVALRYDTL